MQAKPSITRPLSDVIIAQEIGQSHYGNWQDCPFNIRFSTKKLPSDKFKFLQKPAIYLISTNRFALYLGKYQPKTGNIVRDRLVKHLSTISARGHRLSFGNTNRYEDIKGIIANESLRKNIDKAFEKKFRNKYFRDSGHTTTNNRLRYADKNWDLLIKSKSFELLKIFSVHIFLLQSNLPQSSSNTMISQIEKDILNEIQPYCNREFSSQNDNQYRKPNLNRTIAIIIHSINSKSRIRGWEYAKFTDL
jgi:hypothetical protein